MSLTKAKAYLEAVKAEKRAIPFHRYCGGVGRTAMAKNEGSTTGQGRWPKKSVEFILGLLRNAESNAEARTRTAASGRQLGGMAGTATAAASPGLSPRRTGSVAAALHVCGASSLPGARRPAPDRQTLGLTDSRGSSGEGAGHGRADHQAHPGQPGHEAAPPDIPRARPRESCAPGPATYAANPLT